MKTNKIIKSLFLLLFPMFLFTACEYEKIIGDDQLPPEVSSYVETHFREHTILQSIVELDNFSKTYELILSENYTLKFNRKKAIIDVEGVSKLPDSVIPVKIRDYVTDKYPANYIVGWELDGRNQQVELDNDLDLEFNMKGDFLRIDQ